MIFFNVARFRRTMSKRGLRGGGGFYAALPEIVSFHNDMYPIKLLLGFLLYILVLPFEQSYWTKLFLERKERFFRKRR